ncbi:MAG: hypothetical protein NVSMB26_13270 [Beijerinckiaceae bacterium]
MRSQSIAGARSIARIFALSCAIAIGGPALAAPPDNPDPRLTPWYNSLRQPSTGAECCSLADCRTVEFRQSRDGYEVLVDQRWRLSSPYWARVPAEKILRRDNPTGHAVACFTPEAGIMCFVPPPQS